MKKLFQHEPINLASTKIIQQIDKKTSFYFFFIISNFLYLVSKKTLKQYNTIEIKDLLYALYQILD
jgi:hypothetical protein